MESPTLPLRHARLAHLQTMLADEKSELLLRAARLNRALLTSRKYMHYKQALEQRVRMAQNCVHRMADAYFTMLADSEFLMLTSEMDVIQKVQRFKKNILHSLQKISANLDGKCQGSSPSREPEDECPEASEQDEQEEGKKPSRSKNFKISSDATRAMVEWLLVNFENPYPSTEEKVAMARQGNISITKVNNWFINARERTIKGYFQHDN